MSRRDSAAMVAKTSELLPEPETPVNTVSRRFGISTLMSLRLFSRAPCTRIRSWLSAACGAPDGASDLVAMLIVRFSPPAAAFFTSAAILASSAAVSFVEPMTSPTSAVVEARVFLEAERRVPRLELVRRP